MKTLSLTVIFAMVIAAKAAEQASFNASKFNFDFSSNDIIGKTIINNGVNNNLMQAAPTCGKFKAFSFQCQCQLNNFQHVDRKICKLGSSMDEK